MRKTAKIILIDPNGPNGLQQWEQMDYKNLVSGTPVQRGHLYHEIQEQGYMVGVWDCTAFTDQMMPYSVDEYMLLLAGDVAMEAKRLCPQNLYDLGQPYRRRSKCVAQPYFSSRFRSA